MNLDWSGSQVTSFLGFLEMEMYDPFFKHQVIEGSRFANLTNEQLEVWGIQSLGHRKRIIRVLEEFNTPKKWSPERLAHWLTVLGFSNEGKKFQDQHLTGLQLLRMTKDEVFQVCRKLGPAIRIHKLVSEMKSQTE